MLISNMSFTIEVAQHIVWEDDTIVVLDKPAGLMVEPDRNGYKNLLQQVQQYYRKKMPKGKEVYVQHVHRLDRPVSGLVLFAKKKATLKLLSEQFAARTVVKKYQALTPTTSIPIAATLEQYLWKDKKNKQAHIVKADHPEAEKVKLSYTLRPITPEWSCWDILLHTGKYHQIRAQLAAQGAPILGDTLYGSTYSYGEAAIALHAYHLECRHPISEERLIFNSAPKWRI